MFLYTCPSYTDLLSVNQSITQSIDLSNNQLLVHVITLTSYACIGQAESRLTEDGPQAFPRQQPAEFVDFCVEQVKCSPTIVSVSTQGLMSF
jgi:hypothetical protein